jgi:hypothetical protein
VSFVGTSSGLTGKNGELSRIPAFLSAGSFAKLRPSLISTVYRQWLCLTWQKKNKWNRERPERDGE